MKKYTEAVIIAVVLLLCAGIRTDAARSFFVNGASTPFSLSSADTYAVGASGTELIASGQIYALTADGLAALDREEESRTGGLLFDDGAVQIAADTIRVGMRYYYSEARDSSMEEAYLENAEGRGYAFGYLDESNLFIPFDENAFTGETQITVRPLGNGGVGVFITGTDTMIYSMESTGKDRYLAIHPIREDGEALTWFARRMYYGDFAFAELGNGGLTVVNVVNIEKYVMGVCSGEMGSGFPSEALKAQAVAARTYAMFNIHNSPYNDRCGFDVTNDDYSQVYLGYTEFENIKEAVEATENQYLTYRGEIIDALFFAADGGETLNSEDVFASAMPYLRGVTDPYEAVVWNRGAYGHQVGMSQWGAYAMAKFFDKNYKEILGFYYTNVGLSYGYQ